MQVNVVLFLSLSMIAMVCWFMYDMIVVGHSKTADAQKCMFRQSKNLTNFTFLEARNKQLLEINKQLQSQLDTQNAKKPNKTSQEIFNTIYEKNVWGRRNDLQGGNGSGIGSDPRHTIYTREILRDWIHRYNISKMLDAPCGSMTWIPLFLQKCDPPIEYLGIDVVKSLIQGHREHFSSSKWMKFQVCDLTSSSCGLPLGYDVIFTRDALQHWPSHLVRQFIENIKDTDATFWVTGSYVHLHGNREIEMGDYFDINLLDPPYSLPPPLEILSEGIFPGVIEKWLLIWEIEILRHPIRNNLSIPRMLYQMVWENVTLDQPRIPSHWQYEEWDTQRALSLVTLSYPSCAHLYHRYPHSIRYILLHFMGGFYVDPNVSVDLERVPIHAGAVFSKGHLIGSRKGHPIMYDILREMKQKDHFNESYIISSLLQRRRHIYSDLIFL